MRHEAFFLRNLRRELRGLYTSPLHLFFQMSTRLFQAPTMLVISYMRYLSVLELKIIETACSRLKVFCFNIFKKIAT
jgi:hypothetical protein